jgi:hypothetical protein
MEFKVLIEEAYEILLKAKGIKINGKNADKGSAGKKVEELLGLKASSKQLDFSNGELKTITLNNKGSVKEDLKIARKWDKTYIKQKLENILLVIKDHNDVIEDVKLIKILDNKVYSKYFDIEFDKIMHIGLDNISQSDTIVWVAKTNDTGKKEKNARAFYLSRQFLSAALGYPFSARKPEAKKIYEELNESPKERN